MVLGPSNDNVLSENSSEFEVVTRSYDELISHCVPDLQKNTPLGVRPLIQSRYTIQNFDGLIRVSANHADRGDQRLHPVYDANYS